MTGEKLPQFNNSWKRSKFHFKLYANLILLSASLSWMINYKGFIVKTNDHLDME